MDYYSTAIFNLSKSPLGIKKSNRKFEAENQLSTSKIHVIIFYGIILVNLLIQCVKVITDILVNYVMCYFEVLSFIYRKVTYPEGFLGDNFLTSKLS